MGNVSQKKEYLMKKRVAVVIAIFAILLLVAGAWAWRWSRNVLVLENESGGMAKVVTVTVCGKSYRVENLHSGDAKRIIFDVTGDSGFQVDVSLEDGTELAENFGYVTDGFFGYHNRATVQIHKNGIEGKQE